MHPARLRAMVSTGSPGLIDHAVKIALRHLDDEKPRARHCSLYAIPVITHGIENADTILNRSIWLRQAYRS